MYKSKKLCFLKVSKHSIFIDYIKSFYSRWLEDTPDFPEILQKSRNLVSQRMEDHDRLVKNDIQKHQEDLDFLEDNMREKKNLKEKWKMYPMI